jgi:CRISPR system Cascade subunit CasC
MHLELHALQNFALSNLNRDDTGAPKTCEFGGYRRARISSQCLKRAARVHMRETALIPSERLSLRSKGVAVEIAKRLTALGETEANANLAAERVLALLSLKVSDKKTEYLLFMGEAQIARLVQLCREHAAVLTGSAETFKAKTKELAEPALAAVKQGDAVDLALFGRMIANKPEINVDAAVQMAHAFSTHAVAMEFDYYTAVDDLQEEADDAGLGAGMIGTTLYNASCYYRYANLNLPQLLANLDGNHGLAQQAVDAFIRSFIDAVPSGKQTNAAAQNPPTLVMAVVREQGLWSLANAFVKPVRPHAGMDLCEASADALYRHWNALAGLYGVDGIQFAGVATLHQPKESTTAVEVLPNMAALADGVRKHLSASLA